MNKLVYPEANEALSMSLEGKFATIITNDKFYTNIKKASSNVITEKMLEDCKPDKDHFAIHFVGVGDYEKYGFNKNADSFPKTANIKYFKTFETDGQLYREHNSSSPDKAIGQIKKAAYNEDMGRIEVVVWANIKKASAEYEKALNGEALSCSMGMHCPYDRDNISGKLSKTPAEYEPWMKKRAGQYIEEWDGKPINKYAFVHNDKFRFFDLSIVAKPAERIARYLEYKFASEPTNGILKAASSDKDNKANLDNITSADLAKIVGLTLPNNAKLPFAKAALLKKLVELEKECDKVASLKTAPSTNLGKYIKFAAPNAFYKKASKEHKELVENAKCLKSLRPETLLREFAKRASILPFDAFMNVFYSPETVQNPYLHEEAIKYASAVLIPNVFKNLMDDMESLNPASYNCCEIEDLFDAGDAVSTAADVPSDPVQQFMDAAEKKLSLDPKLRGDRTIKVTINIDLDNQSVDLDVQTPTEGDCTKLASIYIKKLAHRYANEYGIYKISALNDIAKFKGEQFLDDPTLIATIAQNQNF